MLISPAEPLILRELGTTSSAPEKYGADFLISSPVFGLIGVQRKELSDLVASHSDDRISRECISMKELDHALWLIEGTPQWSSDGQAMWTRAPYTRTRHHGWLFSLTFQGFSVLSTSTITESGLLLSSLERWLAKEKHRGINGRPAPRGEWGRADEREWQVHFLSGLPGLGPTRAEAILDYFGRVPLELSGDISKVPGVGKKTAEQVRRIFE
jgi:ERCC4-type nuclease